MHGSRLLPGSEPRGTGLPLRPSCDCSPAFVSIVLRRVFVSEARRLRGSCRAPPRLRVWYRGLRRWWAEGVLVGLLECRLGRRWCWWWGGTGPSAGVPSPVSSDDGLLGGRQAEIGGFGAGEDT